MRTLPWRVCFVVLASCSGASRTTDAADSSPSLDVTELAPLDAVAETPVSFVPPPPFLRDALGGALVLRGTNVAGASKDRADFLPPYGAADFVRLRDELGLNSVRLMVFWEAIEPTQGAYDAVYLAAVRAKVVAAANAGLHVVVDMHQDVYGRGFGFDGAPRWTCDAALYAAFQPPANWALGYLEPQVQTCFDRFYAAGAIRAAFVQAWVHLARTLRGAGVFGYELLNEPGWGSATPQDFDRTISPGFYADLIDAIRVEDSDPWVFVEPAPTASFGLATNLRPPARPRLVYGPHMYLASVEQGSPYAAAGASSLASITDRQRRDAIRLALPVVVGETGVRRDVVGAAEYLHDAYDALDANMLGVMQWALQRSAAGTYGLWDLSGGTTLVATAIARPYPRRVAGTPLAWHWDGATGVFTMDWSELGDGSVAGDSEVAVPALTFPNGIDVVVADGGSASLAGTVLRIPRRGAGVRRLTLTRR